MKRKLRLIIGLLLLLCGVVLLALPTITNYIIQQHSQNLTQKTSELDVDTLKANLTTETSFNFEEIKSISVSNTFSSVYGTSINYDQIIGQITIPSINVNLTLFNGTNNENLLAGAATMKPNQTMGERNFAIASHTTNSKGALFTDLIDIPIGATVRITNKETIYEYKIYDARVVSAYDVYLIEDAQAEEHGSPIISLMSCYYLDNPDKRFFAFGELVNTYPYTKEAMVSTQE